MGHKVSYVVRSPRLMSTIVGMVLLTIWAYYDMCKDFSNLTQSQTFISNQQYLQLSQPVRGRAKTVSARVHKQLPIVRDNEELMYPFNFNASHNLYRCTPVEAGIRLEERPVNTKKLEEKLKKIAIDNKVIVTFASNSQRVLLRNFMCSVNRKHTNWMVVSYDVQTAHDVERLFGTEHSFYDPDMLGEDMVSDWERNSTEQEMVWRNLMFLKVNTVRAFLRLGVDVFVADADTSVVRNIPQYADLNDNCDFKFQPDSKYILTLDGYRGQRKLNCGVYFARSSPAVLALYDVWAESFNCKEGFREQRALHVTMTTLTEHHDFYMYDPRTDTPFYTDAERMNVETDFDAAQTAIDPASVVDLNIEHLKREGAQKGLVDSKGVKMCYFDPKDFPNGGLYFAQNRQFRKMYGAKAPVMLHTNYMKSRLEKKISALGAVGAWFLDEELHCSAKARKPLKHPLKAKALYALVDQ
eukprot:CFRG3801T1